MYSKLNYYFVSGRFCPDPPNPPADHNMVLVGYNGQPIRIRQASLTPFEVFFYFTRELMLGRNIFPYPPGRGIIIVSHFSQDWVFRCKDGMRLDDDIEQTEFRASCVAGNSFDPVEFATWPKCQPCKCILCYPSSLFRRNLVEITCL